jgi:bifunctional non-homologous end joining protein LigD
MPVSLAPPRFIALQLSKTAEKAPGGEGWAHEIKYDGLPLARPDRREEGAATDATRRRLDRPLSLHCRCAREAPGEIRLPRRRALRPQSGRNNLNALHVGTDPRHLVYFVFDLLFLDGEDLQGRPLKERKDRLRKLLLRAPKNICYVDYVIGEGHSRTPQLGHRRLKGEWYCRFWSTARGARLSIKEDTQ